MKKIFTPVILIGLFGTTLVAAPDVSDSSSTALQNKSCKKLYVC